MRLHKKISTFVLLATLLDQAIFSNTAFASFPDITTNLQNYTAIIYLQEHGIINGYPDGTFKPEKPVNRAEFLKIIIEGSAIKTNISIKTPFNDVNDKAWYAPYVRKAYTENWIQGYTDGTFKPDQTITKVEALKIIGKAQNWKIQTNMQEIPYPDTQITDWFIPYVTFAKTNELLEEKGKLLFPNKEMSRANISEIIYRTIIKGLSQNSETTQTPTLPQTSDTSENIDLSPITESQISSNYYSNISLDSSLPTTFYQNEIYIIKGTVTSGSYENATVSIDQTTFTEPLSNNQFEIPIIFRKSGTFSLGILPGDNGNTKIQTISVLSTLPSSTNNDVPPPKTTPSISFSNDKTFVTFNNTSSTIKRLTLLQGTKSVSYITRQSLDNIEIYYKDFKNFSKSSTSYYIESAKISSSSPLVISSDFSKSETKTFTPTYHDFSFIDEENVTSSPPETMDSPSKISFTVTTSVALEPEGYVTKPDGFTERITLSKNGDTYTYSYTPTSSGTYIVEVNNTEGIAVVNHPVYIGNKIPLLPDFFDKNNREYFTETVSLSSMRNELLNDINNARTAQGLSEVVLSDELNTLAQAHSDDMANNNYFSHTGQNGKTPEDRRKTLGIKTPVAENLAKDVAINFAHEGLMRSGSHKENILEKEWTRVGIGIAKTQNDGGYLMITEEFSTDSITPKNLSAMKEELFTKINENTALTNDIFSDAINSFNISGQSEAIGHSYNLWSTILNSILTEATLTTENWLKIGIDIQADLDGIINTFVIINK